MSDAERLSPFERLNHCRIRLAALRLSTIVDGGALHDAVEACWSDVSAAYERSLDDLGAIETLCARVDRLVDASRLIGR